MGHQEATGKVIHGEDLGPLITEGYVVNKKGGKLTLQEVTLPPMSATMVQVKIDMVGLCHSDVHMRDNDFAISNYPLLVGHEGVGTITEIGSRVKNMKVGDTVGIGWMRDSCTYCMYCTEGRENICEKGYQGLFLSEGAGMFGSSPLEYNLHGGCFARYQRIEERFAIKMPNGISPELFCPLVCAGATVYEPLCDYASIGKNVGVMGIGGLGTCAIKLARLRGCFVWALSRSKSKREGAIAAGAHHFIDMKNEEENTKALGKLDLIIDTTPSNTQVMSYLQFLRINGTFCKLGVPQATDSGFSVDWRPIIFLQRRVVGSGVCGTKRTAEMLNLVAANLKFMQDTDAWKSERIPMSKVNEAMDELQHGTNRAYRYIMEWD
ncbi:alcohol dehydrogenase [Gracilaria domingensis]|nr:alcohol dehydrogenase [Gracilaria domingensis]